MTDAERKQARLEQSRKHADKVNAAVDADREKKVAEALGDADREEAVSVEDAVAALG